MTDTEWMARALDLARRAEGRTSPNPMVGCVIVDRHGQQIADGYHQRPGADHAEVVALERAGKKARGATLYVNLEPCVHHGRTPPCAPQVLAAGIRRVVVGMPDPIEGHGGGAAWLRRRRVRVDVGVMQAECEELNAGFLTWARLGRPRFLLKAALTLDGRVATHTGQSRWITGPEARADGHRLRARLDAILVGVGTALADNPRLTARGVRGARDPIRIVVDSRLRTPPTARLLPANSSSPARTLIATTAAAPASRQRRLEQRGAEVWRLPGASGSVSVARLARRLGKEGITSVLVEGGPRVHGSLLAAGLCDEALLYIAPLVLGGRGQKAGPVWLSAEPAKTLKGARRLRFSGPPLLLGKDLRLRLVADADC